MAEEILALLQWNADQPVVDFGREPSGDPTLRAFSAFLFFHSQADNSIRQQSIFRQEAGIADSKTCVAHDENENGQFLVRSGLLTVQHDALGSPNDQLEFI